jgi:hypothetical protein
MHLSCSVSDVSKRWCIVALCCSGEYKLTEGLQILLFYVVTVSGFSVLPKFCTY